MALSDAYGSDTIVPFRRRFFAISFQLSHYVMFFHSDLSNLISALIPFTPASSYTQSNPSPFKTPPPQITIYFHTQSLFVGGLLVEAYCPTTFNVGNFLSMTVKST